MADFGPTQKPSFLRWGIPREPAWVDGAPVVAPAANTKLVSKTVSANVAGRIFGVQISADEGNTFYIFFGTVKQNKKFSLGAQGTVFVAVSAPLLDNIPTGTVITIQNVNGGAGGVDYQCSLLYDEG